MRRDPGIARRGVFRHVHSRLLDQRAVDAGRRAGRRSRRRRRDRDDREHLYPYRAGNDAQRGGNRGIEGNFLRRHFDDDHARGRLFPDRFHAGHDRPPVPRVQSGRDGRRAHFGFRGADLHSDAGYQDARAERAAELVLPGDRAFLRRDEPPLCPDAGGIHAPEGRGHTGRAVDCGDDLGALEPYPVRDGSARGPLVHIDQHARGRGSHLRVHTRLYRGHQPSGRLARSRGRGHYGPRVERERQCPDFASGYCRPRPLADGDRRGVVESRPIQDDGPCFRAAAEYVRWPPEPDARAVRAAGDQSREAPAGTARIYGEGLREPRFPDGRRRSEVQQARGPHHDQPRQGRSDGRQYARHSRNPSVRPQRPAHGLFLHERQAVRDSGRDQSPTAQQADRPQVDLRAQRGRRDGAAR